MPCTDNDADAARVSFGARLRGCSNRCAVALPRSSAARHDEARRSRRSRGDSG